MAETIDKGMTRRRPCPGTMTFSGSSSNAMFKTSWKSSQIVAWVQFDQTIHFGGGGETQQTWKNFGWESSCCFLCCCSSWWSSAVEAAAAHSNGCRRAFLPFNQYNHLNFFFIRLFTTKLAFFSSDQFFRVVTFVTPWVHFQVNCFLYILYAIAFSFFPLFCDQDNGWVAWLLKNKDKFRLLLSYIDLQVYFVSKLGTIQALLVIFFFFRRCGDSGISNSTRPWALSKSIKVSE